MADGDSSGPGKATMALIAVLALPVVLVLVFLFVGSVRSSQASSLPDLHTKGLKWAQARAGTEGFGDVGTHDALGRDRGQRDAKSWMVCFQVPPAGQHTRKTQVELGVVQVSEKCPTKDQGRINPAGALMPPLIDRTAYMATVSLGDNASVRFIDVATKDTVTHNLGDYRICAQEPAAGAAWDGVPVKAAVVPYEQDCDHPKGAPSGLDAQTFLNRVLDLLPG
jgi:hypothetical protein